MLVKCIVNQHLGKSEMWLLKGGGYCWEVIVNGGSSVVFSDKQSKIILTLVQLNPDMYCLCKQCRSRSVGF